LLTGCNSGLGRETLRVLRLRGARVFGTGRTVARAQQVCEEFGATPIACELSEPASVLACVASLSAEQVRLDGIICNAGIMALPKLSQRAGYELQFFTNHVGHFLLVTRLLPLLAPAGRVVMVSSNAHRRAPKEGIQFDNLGGEKAYNPWRAYGQSKLANLLFARHLARRLAGTGQTANALHPGVIATSLTRNTSAHIDVLLKLASPLVFKSIQEGAATQCYVATHPSLATVSGEYFSHCNLAASTAHGSDLTMAARLWDVSERIVADVTA
jgi:NAD(P)-dependent dehydrogenase (short-subunit alcohol dehydrogenase family)